MERGSRGLCGWERKSRWSWDIVANSLSDCRIWLVYNTIVADMARRENKRSI